MAQYIFGKNTIMTRLQKGEDIEEVLISSHFNDARFIKFFDSMKVTRVSDSELDRLTGGVVHQGIVARIKTYEFTSLDKLLKLLNGVSNPLLVMLDGIEDPHNFGAILRSCEAMGVQGVLVPKHRSAPLNATVAKVSTGAIEFIPVIQVTNLTQTIQRLKEKGFWVVGAEATNANDYREVDYQMPTLLVIGSEGKGISRLVLEQCDFKVKLPMLGKINSLNASVATAVLLYQIYNSRFPLNTMGNKKKGDSLNE
jgi:23S rRNA (guanosine2251-2'-O)-methyltransferase